jgi:NhaA family Na+:H+ antiporter
VDDIGAVLVIAFFYGANPDFIALALAGGGISVALLLGRLGVSWLIAYYPLVVLVWFGFHEGGIHPTLVGIVFGLMAPTVSLRDPRFVDAEALTDVSNVGAAAETASLARESVSVVEWLEFRLHPWSSYLALPLFALANAGVPVTLDAVEGILHSPVSLGVILGLVVGKVVGISLFSVLAVRSGVGELPAGVAWRHVFGIATLAGTGFTVAIFVTELAFTDVDLVAQAKVATLCASTVALVAGATLLKQFTRKESLQ